MTNQRTVTASPGEQNIAFSREFDAPAKLVFEAHTDAALLGQWTGPRGTQMTMREFNARTGGSWSYDISGDAGEWGDHDGRRDCYVPSVRDPTPKAW